MIKRLLLLAVLVVTACATPYTLIEPQRQVVAGAFSVQPSVRWNQSGMAPYEGKIVVWTLDGPALNDLIFIAGVSEGEALFRLKASSGSAAAKDEQPPVFRRSMTNIEIEELFHATMARNFNTTIADVSNLKPARFAGGPGFRFDTRFVGRDEVERTGSVVGAVRSGKLYAVWFYGTRIYYYERYLPEFERIVESAQING